MRIHLPKNTVVKIEGIPVTLVAEAIAETSKANVIAIKNMQEQRRCENADPNKTFPVFEYS